jgi:hypothetical protein
MQDPGFWHEFFTGPAFGALVALAGVALTLWISSRRESESHGQRGARLARSDSAYGSSSSKTPLAV